MQLKAFLESINSPETKDRLEAFLESIRSEETKNHYGIYLQKWFEFAGTRAEEENPQKKIIEFIIFLKKQGKSFPAIRNYITPIKTYYQINDVVLNIKKIDRFIPEYKRRRKDKPYTHEQIGKLLSIADERMKAVILLLCSTGIRICAIPLLRIGNLQDRMLTVYEHTPDEYVTFITPECQKAMDSYLDMRSRYGEKLTDQSYLIRDQFDVRSPRSRPKPVRKGGL